MTHNKSPLDMPFFYFSHGLVWHLHFVPQCQKRERKTAAAEAFLRGVPQ